jgi:NADPH2:quinone reductase
MKALQVMQHGAPRQALALRDIEKPEPAPGQVLIRVSAASLNFNDIDRCHGRKTTMMPELPFTIGMDVCGTVDAAGEGAEAWLGKRVMAITFTAMGGLAEYAIAPADATFEVPDGLDDHEACSFIIPFHTTHLALHRRAHLQAGETLLVHAGASGLGSAAIQLGKAAGATVIATASSGEKLDYCRKQGADHVIDYSDGDYVEKIFELTDDRGADVVCDLVGGAVTQPSWRCTAREGRYITVGFADDPENGMTGHPLRPLATGNFSVVGVMLAWVTNLPPFVRKMGINPFPREVADAVHGDLMRLLEEGKIRPILERRVRLEDAAAALEDHEARKTMGRTAVTIANA